MTDLFSTPAEHAFDHPELEQAGNAIAGPSNNGEATASLDIEEAFEVDDTVRRILEGQYKTVRLDTLSADDRSGCNSLMSCYRRLYLFSELYNVEYKLQALRLTSLRIRLMEGELQRLCYRVMADLEAAVPMFCHVCTSQQIF
jgi:hypothetical protein